jgi:hypothetical protein
LLFKNYLFLIVLKVSALRTLVESHVAASEASSGHGSALGLPGPGGGSVHHVEQVRLVSNYL